jgi:hypothetical protein
MKIFRYVFILFCFMLCASCALAKEPLNKYTVYEGQMYRWNTQMKKYFPYKTTQQRLQDSYLRKQLSTMGSPATKSEPHRIKWWDFYWN